MAYRRRQGITRASTFKEEITSSGASSANGDVDDNQQQPQHRRVKSSASVSSSSLAARAIKASAAHRDSSGFGYAYGYGGVDSFFPSSDPDLSLSSFPKASFPTESTSVKGSDDSKYGFWGILARKAKSVLEDENNLNPYESSDKTRQQTTSTWTQYHQSRQSSERGERMNDTKLRKGLDAFTSSLNRIGDTIGNALEEGRTIVEHKTADIIQETCNKTADIIQETQKLHIRRRGGGTDTQDQATVLQSPWQRPAAIEPAHTLANQQTQLKASRDVAMATAAKAKVLLRELKTVKADLAFAKERCAQLEEENKRLRDSREKGDNPADDDLIRLQLETLLAEKARLAHENSIYARENRFLREIVEYHQLTMQDIVYLDEGAEEVTEVYPFSIDDAKVLSSIPTSPTSPALLPEVGTLICPPEAKEEHTSGVAKVVSNSSASPSSPISPPKLSPEGEGNVQEREMYPIPISIAMDGDPKRSSNSHA